MEDEYNDYYSKSIADEIYEEAFDKLKNSLNEDVKREISELKNWEDRLNKHEEDVYSREKSVISREITVSSKERNLEDEFYKIKLSELLNKMTEEFHHTLYTVEDTWDKIEKCNGCNDDREIVVELPDKSSVTVRCSCDKSIKRMYIKESKVKKIEIRKSKNSEKFDLYFQHENRFDSERWGTVRLEDIYEKAEDCEDGNGFFTTIEEAERYIVIQNEKFYKLIGHNMKCI